MPLLVIQVAVSGELIEVFEKSVDSLTGLRMLALANEDERAVMQPGIELGDGAVWIDLVDEHGETLLEKVACFHRADADDALMLYFDMTPSVVRDCLSRANVSLLHARRKAATDAYLRKVGRLTECSTLNPRQRNQQRLGMASLMDLVTELQRRLGEQDTQLALNELPASVCAAATQLADAAHSYVTAVQQL